MVVWEVVKSVVVFVVVVLVVFPGNFDLQQRVSYGWVRGWWVGALSGQGWGYNIRINLSPNMRGGVITPPSLFHSYQRVFVEMFSQNIVVSCNFFYFYCTIHHVCLDQESKL